MISYYFYMMSGQEVELLVFALVIKLVILYAAVRYWLMRK